MTRSHGGFTVAELETAGITPNTRDIARAMTPGQFRSADAVAGAAPGSDTERAPGEQDQPVRRAGKKERDAQVLQAERAIMVARARRVAKLPYSIWAGIAHDASLRLSPEEEENLTDAWTMLFEAYGWTPGGKLWTLSEVMALEAIAIASRSTLIQSLFVPQPQPEPEPGADKPN
jgi:hypothetical protein